MHSDAFDRYHDTDSFIHHLDPRVKVMVTVVLYPFQRAPAGWGVDRVWTCMGLSIVVNLLSKLGSRVHIQTFVRRPAVCADRGHGVVLDTGQTAHHFPLSVLGPDHHRRGLLRFVSILIRSWLSVQMAILLVAVRASRISSMRWSICACQPFSPRSSPSSIAISSCWRTRSSVCSGRGKAVRRPWQASRSGGGVPGGRRSRGIWRVNFSCGVTSAVTASTMRCWRADMRVISR
jgi:hypothetical protein